MAYPVSDAFLSTIASGSMRFVATISVLSNGAPVGNQFFNIPVETLSVTVDRNNAQRQTMTATLTGLDDNGFSFVPLDLSSPLAPNGNEVLAQVGVVYPDKSQEMVPVGVFPITTVVVTDNGTDLTLQVQASDRSWSISRRTLLVPYIVPTGVTIDQAIAALVAANTSGMPLFANNISPTAAAAPANVYNQGQDPWAAAMDLAVGCGFELYFDRNGNLTGRTIPDPNTITTSWTHNEDVQGGGPLSLTRTLTANNVENDFFVTTGSATTAPVQAEASDSTPTSPTYIGGPFGRIPSFVSSSTASDLDGAQSAADADLTASLGEADVIQLGIIPNPAIDVDDVLTVVRARAGVTTQRWVVDGYVLNIGVGQTMTVTARRVLS